MEGDKPVDVRPISSRKEGPFFFFFFFSITADFSVVRLKPLPNSFFEEGESWALFHYSQLLC